MMHGNTKLKYSVPLVQDSTIPSNQLWLSWHQQNKSQLHLRLSNRKPTKQFGTRKGTGGRDVIAPENLNVF